MIRPTDLDSILERAFGLAFFLHGDREVALRITAAAMEKLEVAASAQHKRLYYRSGFRNRVSLSEPHLLQRLVFIESEPYERLREQAGMDRAGLLVHYLKHLVRITLKRNSFYVALGISRLLFGYSTSEAMEIYQAIVQDPERVKSDYYYRSRKATLLAELEERFGDLLRLTRGAHGEERFEADDDAQGLAGLVEEGLGRFMPWSTPCTMPESWSPWTESILSLTSTSERAEDDVEINRIHTLLHLDCFRRLTAALGLDAPASRLQVPRFFVSGEDRGGPGGSPPSPGVLGKEGLQQIKGRLAEQSTRRLKASSDLLRVLVDGEERARLDARAAGQVSLRLPPGAECIEVRARDEQGEIPLATHLIGPAEASIHLEDGREIAFRVAPDPEGESEGLAEVRHRPPAARPLLVRLLAEARRWPALRPAPVLATLLLLLGIAAAVLFVGRREPPAGPAAAATESRRTPPVQRTTEARPTPPPSGEKTAAQTPPEPRNGTRPHTPTGEENDVLRSLRDPARIAALAGASRLCVEAPGEEAAGREIARGLALRLEKAPRLRVTESVDEADACLKLAIERPGAGTTRFSVAARIVNVDGQELWPASTATEKTYEGSAEEVAAGIAGDLLADLARGGKRSAPRP